MNDRLTPTEALDLDRQASKTPRPTVRPLWLTAGEVLMGGVAFSALVMLLFLAHLFIQGL